MRTSAVIGDEEIEKQMRDTTVGELFDLLHIKMEKMGKPVMMGVQYEDVLFKISCEPVTEKIVARGYEE